MIRKGSLVRYIGKRSVFPDGKKLMVHDIKDDMAIVWIIGKNDKWYKKAVSASELEIIVE